MQQSLQTVSVDTKPSSFPGSILQLWGECECACILGCALVCACESSTVHEVVGTSACVWVLLCPVLWGPVQTWSSEMHHASSLHDHIPPGQSRASTSRGKISTATKANNINNESH